MKPLPPTLRENRRYVLARIDPPWFEIDGRTLYETLSETVTALFGDTGMARIQPAVITTHPGYAIVRCIRSTEADLLAALAAVNHSGPQKIALRSVRTSGTLRALRRAIGRSADPPVMETGEARFQGKTYASIKYQIEKVDLLENGFKSQELLFLTVDDLEE